MTLIENRRRAAVYLRISNDPEGRRLGVDRQKADCRALCDEYGYDVVDVFCDNDISASTRSKRQRPDFDRMLAVARDGKIDVIVAFSTSRLTRKPIEWEGLFDLHDQHGTKIHMLKRGLVDLSKAVIRRDLRNDASSDAYYADEISELVATASSHRAQKGEWHGGRVPYGFTRVGPKGEAGKLEIHPDHAQVIRELAQRILDGHSLYAVCQSLNQRGLRTPPTKNTPDGARWTPRMVKRVVTSHATAGIREYHGQEFPAQWEAILDRETWERIRTVLSRADRGPGPRWRPAHKYLLSGLLTCGREGCGASLTSNTLKNHRISYTCSPIKGGGCGKIRINGQALEEFLVRQLLAVMDVPAVREALSTRDEHPDDDHLRQSIRDDERRLQALEDDHYDELIERSAYRRQRDRIGERLSESRRELAALQRQTFTVDIGNRTMRQAWDDHADDLAWRRTLLFHVIENVTILPHPEGVPVHWRARKDEPAEALHARQRQQAELVFLDRVRIEWWAEKLPDEAPDIDRAAFEHLSHPERQALWLSRMHANRPVQITDPALVGDVAGLMRSHGTGTE